MDCGEGMDCSGLELPDAQLELLKALKETGKNCDRSCDLRSPAGADPGCELADGVITLDFYPGPRGGQAIAEVISGRVAPSGRLPVSLPRSTRTGSCLLQL